MNKDVIECVELKNTKFGLELRLNNIEFLIQRGKKY